jgi:hypothetical protein
VEKFFAERALWRRAVALIAAYAIALASLLTAYTSARAAGETAKSPFAVICHTDLAGQSAPADGHDDGQACARNCCIGCLMLMAALPPPASVSSAPHSAGQPLPLPALAGVATGSFTKSHRSRAPPLTA